MKPTFDIRAYRKAVATKDSKREMIERALLQQQVGSVNLFKLQALTDCWRYITKARARHLLLFLFDRIGTHRYLITAFVKRLIPRLNEIRTNWAPLRALYDEPIARLRHLVHLTDAEVTYYNNVLNDTREWLLVNRGYPLLPTYDLRDYVTIDQIELVQQRLIFFALCGSEQLFDNLGAPDAGMGLLKRHLVWLPELVELATLWVV